MISTLASLVASTSLNVDIQTVATISAIDLNHTTTATIQTIQTTTISNYFYTTIDLAPNRTVVEQNDTDTPVFPSYIRNTSMVFCVVIMCLGVIGNIMVPIVIFKSKDMRNSTNIFLVNLSVADLMVLLVCTPTVLVEVNSKPETWVLGETMCKAVPFVEMTVAHASVLTILAISFERYYAICKPLKAGYVCTKTRASLICLLAWFFAAVFTSPILSIAEFKFVEYFDGTSVPACHTLANSFWSALYFLMTIFLFFIVPLVLLLIIYAVIAKNLISDAAKIVLNKHIDHYSIRARRQVVLMLGTVVLSFFLCLIPFRVFIFWIIIVPDETVNRLGVEKYYNILYFCRIMVYLNSAINPILYNLMSSKFREGFLLCSKNKKLYFKRARNGTLNTTINSYRSSTFRSQSSFRTRHQSMVVKSSNNDSPDSNRSNSSRTKIYSQPDSSKNLEPPEYARSRLDSVEIQHLDTIEQSSRSNPVSSKNGESSKNLDLINYDRSRLDSVEIQHLDTAQHGTTDLKYFRSYLEPYFNRYDSRKGNSKKYVATLAETPVLFLKNESHFENISLENISSNSNGSNPLELDRTDNISSLAASDLNNFELLDESFGSNVVKLKKLKMPKRYDSLQKFDDNLYLKEMFNNKPNIESESFV